MYVTPKNVRVTYHLFKNFQGVTSRLPVEACMSNVTTFVALAVFEP